MKIFRIFLIISALFFAGCSQAINNSDEAVNLENMSRSTNIVTQRTGNKKFPHTTDFGNRIVKPNNLTQSTLNNDIEVFYTYWKTKYLKKSTVTKDGTKSGYYVLADGTGGKPDTWPADENYKSHSEANGYGMILTALMGEKTFFDGLYIMFDSFRSPFDSDLMSWVIPDSESQSLDKTHNATDGDIDMAYALLLAHIQWGSDGDYNYKAQALRTINAIKEKNFNHTTMRVTRGSWDTGGAAEKYSTRSSDWIVAQFQAFYDFTKDSFWTNAINEVYKIIDEVIAADSPNTHLMPDFVEGRPARKATSPFLETDSDDDYAWNACRYPWRVGMGYGHNNDIRSKQALDGLVTWALGACNNNAWDYKAGYELDGTVMEKVDEDTGKHIPGVLVDYSSNAFYSPLAIAASHDSANQGFINHMWPIMKDQKEWNAFFGNSISLMAMIYISGNWWVPEYVPPVIDTEAPTTPDYFAPKYVYKSDENKTYLHIFWYKSTDNVAVTNYVIDVVKNFGTVEHEVIEKAAYSIPRPYQEHFITIPNDHSDGYFDVKVKAKDAAGNESPYTATVRVDAKQDTIPPTAPGNLAGVLNGDYIDLTWTESTDNIKVNYYSIHATDSFGNVRESLLEFSPATTGRLYIGRNSFSNPDSTYWDIKLNATDLRENKSAYASIRVTKGGGNTPEVPVDPAATAKPSSFTLSKNKWGGENTYKITANMYWGQNATVIKLYENGTLIKTVNPTFATPAAQKIEFDFAGKAKGSYVYKIDAINQHGTTTSSNFTYTVTK